MDDDGVALLAEGVGRNLLNQGPNLTENVALLAEGVGRNKGQKLVAQCILESPSSRRAWVEIERKVCGFK